MLTPLPLLTFGGTFGGQVLKVEVIMINHEAFYALAIKIVEQKHRKLNFVSQDGWQIRCSGSPQISDHTLYIRGEHESYDEVWARKMYGSEEALLDAWQHFKSLITIANEKG